MKRPSITQIPPSPDQERHSRMLKYSIAMAVRLACILGCFFVEGWWIIVLAAGAVVLPYFAVVLANVHRNIAPATVERPGGIVPTREDPRADR